VSRASGLVWRGLGAEQLEGGTSRVGVGKVGGESQCAPQELAGLPGVTEGEVHHAEVIGVAGSRKGAKSPATRTAASASCSASASRPGRWTAYSHARLFAAAAKSGSIVSAVRYASMASSALSALLSAWPMVAHDAAFSFGMRAAAWA